jgi:aspartate dehydrogenase
MKVGILGCGAITNIITDFALKEELDVDLRCFYDQDMKRQKIWHPKRVEMPHQM